MDVRDTEGAPDFLYWGGLGAKREIGFGGPVLELCLHSELTVFT